MYQVSGVEKRVDINHVWFAYAKSEASAEHLKKLFQMAGYERISVRNLEDA